jgi:hypothetical protein
VDDATGEQAPIAARAPLTVLDVCETAVTGNVVEAVATDSVLAWRRKSRRFMAGLYARLYRFFFANGRFRATAAFTSVLNARASTVSPS